MTRAEFDQGLSDKKKDIISKLISITTGLTKKERGQYFKDIISATTNVGIKASTQTHRPSVSDDDLNYILTKHAYDKLNGHKEYSDMINNSPQLRQTVNAYISNRQMPPMKIPPRTLSLPALQFHQLCLPNVGQNTLSDNPIVKKLSSGPDELCQTVIEEMVSLQAHESLDNLTKKQAKDLLNLKDSKNQTILEIISLLPNDDLKEKQITAQKKYLTKQTKASRMLPKSAKHLKNQILNQTSRRQ